jgi:hypothetical protein
MNEKTLTTIGQLVDGDRFYFVGVKKEVHELEGFCFDAKAHYNKVINNKPALGNFYRKSTGVNREVIFLGHTKKEI